LSICIPTYNRSSLLAQQLDWLDQPDLFPFEFEVVVADNCSTDDTPSVLNASAPQHYRLRTVRNDRNTGVIANLLNALRHGAGELCVYLADDDRLDPANLIAAVERMMAAPDLVAIYTGWYQHEIETDHVRGIVGKLPDGSYSLEEAGALLDAILRGFLFPELALYRVSVLSRVLFAGATLFWPYPLIDRLLQHGRVATVSAPFYHVIERHSGDGERLVSAGSGHEHRVWVSIQEGINFLLAKYAAASTSDDVASGYLAYLGNQSFFSSVHRKRYSEAYETALTLVARGVLLAKRTTGEWDDFITHVALENFQRCFETMAGIGGIVCVGFASDAFAQLSLVLGQCAGDRPLPISASPLITPMASLSGKAVLAVSERERDILIARGHPPGQILSLEDLRRVFRL
jgi:glycosyltransferase involved in cell wall biosynthesis